MANAKRDDNHVPTMLGTLQSDGATTVAIKVNPANNGLKVVNGTTGTASTRIIAPRDENHVPAWMGVSSADGVTLIPIACDSAGNILIQST
jgi:hypothetical protein